MQSAPPLSHFPISNRTWFLI